MASTTPAIKIAKPGKDGVAANGNVQIASTARKSGVPADETKRKNTSTRSSGPRLKVVIRRLPPGLTREEFQDSLGEEWKLGNGRIDWMVYRPGKVAVDPYKASKASRAYIHLTRQESITALSDKIQHTPLEDARNPWTGSAFLGPPSVEFAPYNRIPPFDKKEDARQGTIDQDRDFIAFLESLTNPISKPGAGDAEGNSTSKEAPVTTTPLITYLKERKARAKDPSKGKGARGAKVERKPERKLPGKSPKILATPTQNQPESKETKAASTERSSTASNRTLRSKQAPEASPNARATRDKKRERGTPSTAAKILQRDLGIVPGSAGKRTTRKETQDAVVKDDGSAPSKIGTTDGPSGRPARSRKLREGSHDGRQVSETEHAAKAPAVAGENAVLRSSPEAKAFLKHASPSQGVTEPLIMTALQTFGPVSNVTIDRKKGFAYADFGSPSALQKAIAASPIKIAEAQVTIVERRTTRSASGLPAATKGSRGDKSRGGPSSRGASRGRGRGGTTASTRPETRQPRVSVPENTSPP